MTEPKHEQDVLPPLSADGSIRVRDGERQAFYALWWTLGLLVASCVLAMYSLQVDHGWGPRSVRRLYHVGQPYGYTRSLSLYVLPTIALVIWHVVRRANSRWRPVLYTVLVIVPLWSLLDTLLANTFFTFPNPDATLGIHAWGWSADRGWTQNIPVEEFAFYLFGCLVIILMYSWAGQAIFPFDDKPTCYYQAVAANPPPLRVRSILVPFAGAAVIIGIALLYKYAGDHPFREGFPGYLLFLVLLIAVPTALAYRVVAFVINVRAFTFVVLTLLMSSVIWEVTLALPHGWWDFQHDAMVGLFITPWAHLPVEEPFLWLAAAWSNVTLFEIWRLYVEGGQPIWSVLTGKKAA